MRSRHTQLGFDFFDAAPAASESSSAMVPLAPGATPVVPAAVVAPAPSFTQSVTTAVSQLFTQVFSPVLTPKISTRLHSRFG